MKFNITDLKDLVKSLEENDISEFSLETKDGKIKLKRGDEPVVMATPVTQVQTQQVAVAPTTVGEVAAPVAVESVEGPSIDSPMVGTFYSAPSPNAPAFVKEGDVVAEGQTLCIVEAMKLMNEVKANRSGKIVKVLHKDGDAIKKGDKLFILD